MRKLKFRAWDKTSKEMYVAGIHDGIFICFDGEIGIINSTMDDWTWEKQKNLILMQYTGLKAKNGEIYEGDIVRTVYDTIGEIIYLDDSSILSKGLNALKGSFNIKEKKNYRGFTATKEIIGNIYENKDLLE